MQFPYNIELHRSNLLVATLLLIHAVAAGCALALPFAWMLRVLFLIPLAVSAWYVLRPHETVRLRLKDKNLLECQTSDGSGYAVSVLPGSTVFSWLIVLRLRREEETRTVSLVLTPGSVGTGQFRILRLWLRCLEPPNESVRDVS